MPMSGMTTIERILSQRGTKFTGRDSAAVPENRVNTARYLAKNFHAFDKIRSALIKTNNADVSGIIPDDEKVQKLLETLRANGLVESSGSSYRLCSDILAREFVSGTWLEVMSRKALLEAGVDEAVCSQKLKWQVDEYYGKNEIDAIGRKGKGLVFVSCKAVKAVLPEGPGWTGGKQRQQLMRYLDEADNLVDHFGRCGDQVVLVVTTDLIDEARNNKTRYPALFGKARVLDVHLVTLEDLIWKDFVCKLKDIVALLDQVSSG